MSLSLQQLEEPPTEIWPSGEVLSIDSGDLVQPFTPIDTPPVTDSLENLGSNDLESTEPVVAIDPLTYQIDPLTYPTDTIAGISYLVNPPFIDCYNGSIDWEIKIFPASGEPGIVGVDDQATLGDPTVAEGVSLLLGGNPDTVGDSGVSLSLQQLEEPPTEIWPSGEDLTIDSGDLVRPFAPIDTPLVTDSLENLGSIELESTEPVVAIDPLILPTDPIAAICYIYNPIFYSYSGSIDWEIKTFPGFGEPGLVDVVAQSTFGDSTVAEVNPPDLMGCPEPVADRGVSLPLLSVCQDYPVPEVSSPVGESTEADRDPEPRTGILFRGEIHTMVSADLVQPLAPIAPPPVHAPPENLRSITAVGGTELPKGSEAVAAAPPAPGIAPATFLQPPVVQAAVDPITGNAAWAQPTGLIQPGVEAGRNLADDPVLVATPPPAGSDAPRGSGFPFAQAYPASLAAPSRQGSGESLPITSGSATAEGSVPANTSTLISLTAGLGSSGRDPFVIGWGVESVIPPLIADLIPTLILI